MLYFKTAHISVKDSSERFMKESIKTEAMWRKKELRLSKLEEGQFKDPYQKK